MNHAILPERRTATRPISFAAAAEPADGVMPLTRLAFAYLQELDAELLRHARMPGFVIPTLVFPSLFYIFFACVLRQGEDGSNDIFWLANYASFAAIAPGLFAFGTGYAADSASGFLILRRALPAPGPAYFIAKLMVSILSAALGVMLLLLIAGLTGHHVPESGGALRLILAIAAGTLPFSALGMLIGSFAGRRNVTGFVTLLLIPLAFLSGLLVPVQLLPAGLRSLAIFSPGSDLLALAQDAIHGDLGASLYHAVYLLAFAAILAVLAQWRLKNVS